MTLNRNYMWKLYLFAVLPALLAWSPRLRADEKISSDQPDAGPSGENAEESDETPPPSSNVPPTTGLVPSALETYVKAEYPSEAFAAQPLRNPMGCSRIHGRQRRQALLSST